MADLTHNFSERRTYYPKPSLVDMPPELGKKIFDFIESTPMPDYDKMAKEAEELMKKIIEEKEKGN